MVKIKALSESYAQLDLKDRKILYELDVNARQSTTQIGKKVGLSKQVVTYRINQLLQTGVIQKFYAIYDTAKLGFTTYKILLRLQNVNVAKQSEIITYIENHPHVQFFISCDGMFDLAFNVLARSVSELYDILKDLENKFGDYIAEQELIIMIFSSFFFRDYLLGKSSVELRKPMYFGSQPEKVEADTINKKILHYLGKDARMPVVEIARHVGSSADAIAVRIKKMERAHIIHNYVLLPNFSLLHQTSYKVLFSLHNLTDAKEKALLHYSRSHPNIWFHSKSLGKWNLEINIDVDTAHQFREIMMELKTQFSDIIKEYSTLHVSKVHTFNFYPLKIE